MADKNIDRITDLNNDTLHLRDTTAEKTANKVTSITSASTDAQYPSAKAVYDTLGKPIPVTLTAANWSNNQQTVTVQGILADETKQLIMPTPASMSRDAYEAAAVRAISQAVNSITFDCQSPAPSADLTVYVVITPLGGGAL